MIDKNLEQKYTAKLAESGLTPKDGAALRMEPCPANYAKQFYRLPQATAGIKIPYFKPNGSTLPFYRYRNLEDNRTQWDKVSNAKPQRYIQPKNTGVEVYLPPIGIGVEWAAQLANPDQPLLITEGEFKAAAGCKNDLLTIGLGGVYSFSQQGSPIPFFTADGPVKWEDRQVWIVYDSDAVFNPKVQMAEQALAALLGRLKARPYVVRLPPIDAKKVGLDDYLLTEGPEALSSLLLKAEPHMAVAPLHTMNQRVVFCYQPTAVITLETGKLMSKQVFESMDFATYFHTEHVINKDGKLAPRKVKTAPAWLEWEGRGATKEVVFKPGAEQLTAAHYNQWKGWPHQPAKGDIKMWHKFMDYMFAGYPDRRKWFEQWAAYPIQYPGTKLNQACVFFGVTQGTGKTLVGITIGQIYGEYFEQIGNDDLKDVDNSWLVRKQFILADEAKGDGNKSASYDQLKHIITRETVRVNEKYVPKYSIKDCVNYVLTSNKPNAFKIDITDRRYFVHEAPAYTLEPEFYTAYNQWLKHTAGTVPALFDYFLNIDLTGFNPTGEAMFTDTKGQMAALTRTDIEAWVLMCADVLPPHKDIYTASELLQYFDQDGRRGVSLASMGRALKEAQIYQPNKGNAMPLGNGKSMVMYVVRNADKWRVKQNKELIAHVLSATSKQKYA